MALERRTFLVSNADLLLHLRDLRACRCDVDLHPFAGTVKVHDGDIVVLRAIRKGAIGEPWVATFADSTRVRWSHNGPATKETSTRCD